MIIRVVPNDGPQPEWRIVYPPGRDSSVFQPAHCGPEYSVYRMIEGYQEEISSHGTWGCVILMMHPRFGQNAAVVQALERFYWDLPSFRTSSGPMGRRIFPDSSKRGLFPTVIFRHRDRRNEYLVSIDGTNEASDEFPRASHTTEGKAAPLVKQGDTVTVCYLRGVLSDVLGRQMPIHDGFADSLIPPTASDYQIKTAGAYAEAVFFRLRSSTGNTTRWHKLGHDGKGGRCVSFFNDAVADAYLDIKNNAVFTWRSHLTGQPGLVVDYSAKGYGWNGDRAEYTVRLSRIKERKE